MDKHQSINARAAVFAFVVCLLACVLLSLGCEEALSRTGVPWSDSDMSSTYTSDPTATQAPADPPVDNNPPKLTVPSDGDAANVASILQFVKALGDHVAFLQKPFAKNGTLDQEIRAYRNANGLRVSGIGHHGLPAGPFVPVYEPWLEADMKPKSAVAGGDWGGKWTYGIVQTTGGLTATTWTTDLSTHPWGSSIFLSTDAAGPLFGATYVEASKLWGLCTGDVVEYEVSWSINGFSVLKANTSIGFGFAAGDIGMNLTSAPALNFGDVAAFPSHGVWIARDSTTDPGFWKCMSRSYAGSNHTTTTTVPTDRDTPHRVKIVVVGATASDDAAPHVLFFIDQVQVADHAVDMSLTKIAPFAAIDSNQTETCSLVLGPLKVTPRLALGDSL